MEFLYNKLCDTHIPLNSSYILLTGHIVIWNMSQISLWHLKQKDGPICCQLIFRGGAEQWDMKSKGEGKVAVKKSSGMGIQGSAEWQSGAKGV